jgi:hypothetical protein
MVYCPPMSAEPRARLFIWDLDFLVARHDLREQLRAKLDRVPYRQIAKRRLGRFVVLYLSPARKAESGPNVVWVHVGLDNLAKTLLNAKAVSLQDGLSGTDVEHRLLPDALAVIGDHLE